MKIAKSSHLLPATAKPVSLDSFGSGGRTTLFGCLIGKRFASIIDFGQRPWMGGVALCTYNKAILMPYSRLFQLQFWPFVTSELY
jgi:hypothetical protein